MATYKTECVTGHIFEFGVVVFDGTDDFGRMAKTNPTIDPINDFLLSINDGPWDTFDIAPVVSPAGSERIRMQFSAAETTAAGAEGIITVRIADASASDGWIGTEFDIPVVAAKATTTTDTAALAATLATIAGYLDTEVVAIINALAAISGAIDNLEDLTAEDVWTYLQRSLTGTAAQQTQPVVGSELNITRAATYGGTLTGISIPSNWTRALWTIKKERQKTRPDATWSLLQVQVSNGGHASDGLIVLNGSTSGLTKSDASLSINQAAGTATFAIVDEVTAQLEPDRYVYDLKFFYGVGASVVPTESDANVVATPTQTV